MRISRFHRTGRGSKSAIARVQPRGAPLAWRLANNARAIGQDWALAGTLWLCQIAVFCYAWLQFARSNSYHCAKHALGPTSLAVARASAQSINACVAMAFLPLCSQLLATVSSALVRHARFAGARIAASWIFGSPALANAHRAAGWGMALWTAVHVTAHSFCARNLEMRRGEPVASSSMSIFSQLSGQQLAATQLIENCPPAPSLDARTYLLGSWPGATGHAALVCLCLMALPAKTSIRSRLFRVFAVVHVCATVAFVCLVSIHAHAGFIRSDSGVRAGMRFWRFAVPGLLLWLLVERLLLRYIWPARAGVPLHAHVVTGCNGTAALVHLEFPRETLGQFSPGQFVRVCCPRISRLEWHPFTVSSAPSNPDSWSLHVRIVGPWTRALAALAAGNADPSLLYVRICGPLGAPAQLASSYSALLLVASGIGATAFTALLRQLATTASAQHVTFVWICRRRDNFSWFRALLQSLHDCVAPNVAIRTYLTGKQSASEAQRLARWIARDADSGRISPNPVTGVVRRHSSRGVYFGRPQFPPLFLSLAQRHAGTSVGVFVCGPASLSRILLAHCNTYSGPISTGVSSRVSCRFDFYREDF